MSITEYGEKRLTGTAFVKAFCQEKQIPLRIYYRDVPKLARERGMSEEEAGRQVRYECFGDALEMWKGCKAAVAHNQNDNAETVLFNLFRGSGLKGLSGMGIKGSLPGKKEGTLIRPLLFVTRREIEEYLESGHIELLPGQYQYVGDLQQEQNTPPNSAPGRAFE